MTISAELIPAPGLLGGDPGTGPVSVRPIPGGWLPAAARSMHHHGQEKQQDYEHDDYEEHVVIEAVEA